MFGLLCQWFAVGKKGSNELISSRCSVAEAVDMMDYRAYLCKLALITYMTVTHSQEK